MESLKRYEAFLLAKGIRFIRQENLIMREYNKIIIPLGPAKGNQVFGFDSYNVFRKLKGVLLWWSEYNPKLSHSEWYAVVKNRYQTVEEYTSSKMRNKLRKGLKNCEIKQIEACWLATNGYEVFVNAVSSFTESKNIISSVKFKDEILISSSFSDIIHYWGVFVEGKLIGYTVVYVYENVEANMSEIRIDPEFVKLRPSYALIHSMSEEYILKRGVQYVSNGYRNLLHETNIQNTLLTDFGYEKLLLNLHLKYRFPFYFIVQCLLPFKTIFKRFSTLNAVFFLETIVTNQKKLPK